MVRLALFIFGLLFLIALVWHVGPSRILDVAAGLGPDALLVILLPSLLMYALEALGWKVTLGRHGSTVAFWRLFAIRTAGEAMNLATPTAYVGGEPLKAYLLKRHGVPMVDGLASVVTAKTTMTIAQAVFILLGVAIGFWTLGSSGSPGASNTTLLAAVAGVGLLVIVTLVFVAVQRYGLFTGLLGVLRRCRIRIQFLENREEKLRAVDRTILDFYTRDRRAFLLSTSLFFLGWLAEGLEVYAILYYLGPPADVLTAVSIGALSLLIKGGTFFIPGSLGAQDVGNLILVVSYGYTELTGITFALLRRLRELAWIVIGLLCLAAMGGRDQFAPVDHEREQ